MCVVLLSAVIELRTTLCLAVPRGVSLLSRVVFHVARLTVDVTDQLAKHCLYSVVFVY